MIILKWLKKVRKWLQDEEIIEIEEVIIDDSMEHEEIEKLGISQPEHSGYEKPTSSKRSDLDTKVLYQYPKGQFKFPLIPDKQSLSKRKMRERVREDKESLIQERQKSRSSTKKEREDVVEPERKIGSPKKPFRPTEIPSPIYGFNRPQKQTLQEEVVEFELEEKPIVTIETDELDVPTFFRKSNREEEVKGSSVGLSVPVDEEKAELQVQSVVDVTTSENTDRKELNQNDEAILHKEEQPQPRKKHIPFNVVMLKQDYKRMNVSGVKEPKVLEPLIIEKKQELKEEEHLLEAEEMVQDRVIEEATNLMNTEENKGTLSSAISFQEDEENPYYVFPDIGLLAPPTTAVNDEEWLEEQTTLLDETLKNFNVRARVVNVTQGPAVTRFEVYPEPGVKVNKVTNLMDDIKLSLAAQDMRMEAPIPGKHTIGIEIPNRQSKPVFLREVLESETFQNHPSPLAVALGLDISGQPIVTDLRKMPHGLIAGQTGSGKSVCINTMLVSLLYKATPQELKLMLIDPKMVELAPYNRIPHLVSPVITDVKAATAALKWAVEEMERRYELFVHAGVRDITKYNEQAELAGQYVNKLPYILIIIDELADLMMMSPTDVEEAICRIAQKARACGIHLIVATQRPSVDVITGLIKANIPTRIAFSVSSQVDSRTIIDSGGAEKLLGRGDMLFAENGSSKTVRLQGTFVSDDEIDQVVQHVKKEQQPNYLFEQEELLNRSQVSEETDELFFEACEFVVSQNAASTSSIQRRFRVGYNRAARLMEMMEKQGIISESRGSKAREVLISEEELEFLQ